MSADYQLTSTYAPTPLMEGGGKLGVPLSRAGKEKLLDTGQVSIPPPPVTDIVLEA